jgi:hypothetical protein
MRRRSKTPNSSCLQREQFEKLWEEHKRLACHLVEAVAKVLALRLRYSDKELMAMQE